MAGTTAAPGTTTASSPVKDAIDAQSGRFEFFKQTLTLGSAGLAGIAALFTDPARIPTDVAKWAVFAAGVALFTMLLFAVWGLSTYANLLTALAREVGLITGQSHRPSSTFSDGVIQWARAVMIALILAWVSLAAFAGYRLFMRAATSAETALATARTLVSKETGQPPESLFLTRLEADNETFRIAFSVQAIPNETSVTISKKDGTVIRIVQTRTTTPAPTSSPKIVSPRSATVASSAILFDHDSLRITAAENRELSKLIDLFHHYDSCHAEIRGTADATGPEKYNLWLSWQRANAVAAVLTAGGVDPWLIQITPRGSADAHPGADRNQRRAEARVSCGPSP
jgi:outer membrane protein OmpA-like peptidoglycan-associated protein